MIKLESPVTEVPKIGPKYQKLLQKLDISTVEELLYHFPFRYNDFSNIRSISSLFTGEIATVEAVLERIDNIYTRNRKRLTKAIFADKTGKIEATWFNQHYLKNNLEEGKTYYVSGKVGQFSNKLNFIAPEVEIKKQNNINTARLVPVYPETAGISSKWLRSRIHDLIQKNVMTKDCLPEDIIKKYEFPNLKSAIKNIHFPEDKNSYEKSRNRFAFEELLIDLLKVEEQKSAWRQQFNGIPLEISKWQKKVDEFIKNLPFSLTSDQKKAVEEIRKDLGKKHPMNRLLEGDVGTGKTIVATIGAYETFLNGYKTLYMAPTEILAQQHYETISEFLKDCKVKISLQTSKKRVGDRNATVIIGTHSLLFKKEQMENVGFVIIDEQHRFGVQQRQKLVEMCAKTKMPHLLTMTATPIPRTLALTLYGDLDISTLKETPNKDKKITTWVIPENKRQDAYKWIKEKKEQVFVVCPLIEESENEIMENVKAAEVEYENLKSGPFKSLKVGLLHGKMKSAEKESALIDFRNKKLDVLVSTPVIEVGVDIPEATIMIIESAERYGLASLHQLRGRVGRGQKEAFCMLFMSNYSKKAYARLKHMENTISGMKLAEIDLKNRGQGDLFGTMQHGYKKFKLADITNTNLLESVKKEAQKIYPEIKKYPVLQEKIGKISIINA